MFSIIVTELFMWKLNKFRSELNLPRFGGEIAGHLAQWESALSRPVSRLVKPGDLTKEF